MEGDDAGGGGGGDEDDDDTPATLLLMLLLLVVVLAPKPFTCVLLVDTTVDVATEVTVDVTIGAISSLEACVSISAGSEGTCTRGSKSVKHLGAASHTCFSHTIGRRDRLMVLIVMGMTAHVTYVCMRYAGCDNIWYVRGRLEGVLRECVKRVCCYQEDALFIKKVFCSSLVLC